MRYTLSVSICFLFLSLSLVPCFPLPCFHLCVSGCCFCFFREATQTALLSLARARAHTSIHHSSAPNQAAPGYIDMHAQAKPKKAGRHPRVASPFFSVVFVYARLRALGLTSYTAQRRLCSSPVYFVVCVFVRWGEIEIGTGGEEEQGDRWMDQPTDQAQVQALPTNKDQKRTHRARAGPCSGCRCSRRASSGRPGTAARSPRLPPRYFVERGVCGVVFGRCMHVSHTTKSITQTITMILPHILPPNTHADSTHPACPPGGSRGRRGGRTPTRARRSRRAPPRSTCQVIG